MNSTRLRRSLLSSSMICSAGVLSVMASSPAFAADNAPDAVQAVVVTGSRIPQPNLTSASPLTVVGAGEIKAEGTVNIETLLNNLPSIVPGQNSTVSNGATGTATVDLRGLGPQRTLVLIDGKRLMAGDPGLPVADLNFIPTPLVNRVEVLTGGAASVYGADAVAGVVNFVMKRNFEGLQLDVQEGFDNHSNGNSDAQGFLNAAPFSVNHPGNVGFEQNYTTYSAVMGASAPDGKGNVTAYAEYTHLQPITQDTRDFSACTVTDVTSAKGVTNGAHGCAGSSNSDRFNPVKAAGGGAYTSTPTGFAKFANANRFNYGPYNYFQRADDRYNIGTFAHYEVNKHADVYMDLMAMDDHTIAQIAPSGLFQGPTYYIPCNNPFLVGNEAATLGCGNPLVMGTQGAAANSVPATIGFRFLGAPRQDDLRHTDYRIVIGTKGEIADGWSYDLYGQYGTSIYAESYHNDASISKIQNALNATSTTTCSVGGSCVPLNIFAGPQGVTAAMLNYVLTPGFKDGSTTEQVVEGDVTGDLTKYGGKSPWAANGIGVAIGADYRREALVETVDQEESSGDLSGSGGATPPAAGSFELYELYGELKIPLISDKPFIKSLDFNPGYRFSDYSNVGTTSTEKFEFIYAMDSNVKLRASYNKAVRSPNIDELYQPTTVGLYTGQDPCSGSTPKFTAAQCALTGVSNALYGAILPCPATQCSDLVGGNAKLKPEDAETITYGVVFTPQFIKRFSFTADVYDILVTNLISSIPSQVAVDQCGVTGLAEYCSLVHRDPNNGSLLGPNGYMISTSINTGYLHTRGIDFTTTYHLPVHSIPMLQNTELGALDFDFEGTYTELYRESPYTGGGGYNCNGLYGPVCNQPQPYWRNKLRVTWTSPYKLDLSLQWRFIGGVKLDTNESNPLLNNGAFDVVDAHIPAYSYIDFSGNYTVTPTMTIRWGINNLFDKDPPILSTAAIGGYGNGNTYPGTWDSLGRTVFVGATKKF